MAKENYYELKGRELFRQYVAIGKILDNKESENLFMLAFSCGVIIGTEETRKIYSPFVEKNKKLLS